MVQTRGTIFINDANLPKRGRVANASPDPLAELLREADNPLYVLKTVFPLVLFTDKVIIRTNHIDVIRGIFFWSAASTRIQVADIRQVEIQFNPLFATLEIIPQGPLEQTLRVSYVWKNQAQKARRIIAGLMESNQKHIDLAQYKRRDLVAAMELLGKAKE